MVRIATVDGRYQSYNIEMAEVVGGKFWKPYASLGKVVGHGEPAPGGSKPMNTALRIGQDAALFEARPPVDLSNASNARLRKFAVALGLAYERVSGTWANSVFFQDSDAPAPPAPPKGFESVLTRRDQATLTPRPNYWAALLWRRLMGPIVLDLGPSRPGLHFYAQCLRDNPGVALLAINTKRTEVEQVDLPMPANRYTLTAEKLDDAQILLNGHKLTLAANDELPLIEGERIPAGQIGLAPASVTFLAVADAGNQYCQ